MSNIAICIKEYENVNIGDDVIYGQSLVESCYFLINKKRSMSTVHITKSIFKNHFLNEKLYERKSKINKILNK